MPDIFKALASVTAWGLFIFAWVMGLSAFIEGIVSGDLYGSEAMPMGYPITFAVAGVYAIFAVVAMLIRKKLE